MRQAVFEWMKTITFFYLLLTVCLHLLPDSSYEKYLRQFMGLYLMTLLVIPVLSVIRDGSEVREAFERMYTQEIRETEEKDAERLQEMYLKKGMEVQVKEQIQAALKYMGTEWKTLEVVSEGEKFLVTLIACGPYRKEKEAQILDELERRCAVISEHCTFTITFDDTAAVDGFSSSGTSAAGSGYAGEKESDRRTWMEQ